jgi:hypothetical protein
VNYLTDEGGPTVVFDQFPTEHGLTPPLPQRVGIGFAKKNRMLLFKGNRYHGVMVSQSVSPLSVPELNSHIFCLETSHIKYL